ncbi:MAG TPA: hypothetical protein PLY80_04500, partial [Pseudomonadota bacterium]|nr:hypothetical protein [Pseudomonadota bacterium]
VDKQPATQPAAKPVAEPVAAKPAPVAVPEAVPEEVWSGRLGERLAPGSELAASALLEPPAPSSVSPIPFAGPAPRIAVGLRDDSSQPLSFEAVAELLDSATTREDIIAALLRGARSRGAFAALFTKHHDFVQGRLSLGTDFGQTDLIEKLVIPTDKASPFATALARSEPLACQILETDVGADVLKALERPVGVSALLVPIIVRAKSVALLYVDDDGSLIEGSVSQELRDAAAQAGQAWARLQTEDRPGPTDKTEKSLLPLTTAPMPTVAPGTSIPAPVADQPTTPMRNKKGKSGDSPKPAPAAEPAKAEGGKKDADAKKEVDLSALVDKAGNGDDDAFAKLLAAGEAGARAVVSALPGPLRGADRRSIGDPTPTSAASQGPLLSLVLRLGEAAISPILERIANPKTPAEIRGYLIMVLAEAPASSALTALGDLLCDRSETVRTAALSALRSFPPSAPLRALNKWLIDQLSKGDDRRRSHAIEALVELRETSIVPELISLLSDADPACVETAQRALVILCKQDFGESPRRWNAWWSKHGSEPRLSWLLRGLSHADQQVRALAQDELTQLSGDVAGYRSEQPKRERELAAKRWTEWWQRRGYAVE